MRTTLLDGNSDCQHLQLTPLAQIASDKHNSYPVTPDICFIKKVPNTYQTSRQSHRSAAQAQSEADMIDSLIFDVAALTSPSVVISLSRTTSALLSLRRIPHQVFGEFESARGGVLHNRRKILGERPKTWYSLMCGILKKKYARLL